MVTVSVTNTGSVAQTFQVTPTSIPMGFITGSSKTVLVEAHSSQEMNITVIAPSLELA